MKHYISKYRDNSVFLRPDKENSDLFMKSLGDEELTQELVDFVELLVITHHPIIKFLNYQGWEIEEWLIRLKKALELKNKTGLEI